MSGAVQITAHPVSDAALETDIAIIGKKGRGKSFTARGLVERLLDGGRRVIVLDPLSTWWGLKAGPNAYPIPVLGGPRADLPLEDKDGRALGRFLATAEQSAVFDLGAMRKAELIRFATPFLEELYTHNRTPLWLVLEEADVFAPQHPMNDQAHLLGEVDRIARRGRQFGFRLISLTQRPARLNKDVLTQLSTLIALGVTSPQDRDAIKAWVEGAGDRDKAKVVLDSLASLKVGEGWVWSPDQGQLERVTFPPNKTLDTSATPKAGEKRPAAKVRKDVDVAALRAALVTTTPTSTTATAEVPRAMADDIAAAEQRGYDRGYNEGQWRGRADGRINLGTALQGMAETLMTGTDPWLDDEPAPPQRASATKARQTTTPSASKSQDVRGVALAPALQKVLDALGWWRAAGFVQVARARACLVAGYSPRASTFGVYIGELVKRGLVDTGSGTVGLTSAGLAVAATPKHVGWSELRASVRTLLKPQTARVFDAVCQAAPNAIRRDAIARELGLSPTASTVGVYIGVVSRLGLIEPAGAGAVRAAPWLFGMEREDAR